VSEKNRSIATRGAGALEHYDPVRGLATIDVAEVTAKRFQRAKDATGLYDAVELKLSEQRKFVLWWDQQDKATGGRGRKTRFGPETGFPDRLTIHRWRTRLKDARQYAVALEAAQARCVRVCEASKGATDQRGASGTNENEWYTPQHYIDAARDVLGAIDLDPASSAHAQEWIQARQYFDKQANGLGHPWPGRVWLNPPYMQPDIAQFVEKLCREVEVGRTTAAMLLTHNYTDTAWFHRAAGVCAAICFTRGRVAFLNPEGETAAPTQGQAFFYYGQDVDRFAARFAEHGFIVTPR